MLDNAVVVEKTVILENNDYINRQRREAMSCTVSNGVLVIV